MTDPAAIRKLREAVEAGVISTDLIIAAVDEMSDQVTCLAAFDGSMDAALAFKKAVLPGWKWGMHEPRPGVFRGYVSPWSALRPMPDVAENPDPARSLLLACLKAMEAGHD